MTALRILTRRDHGCAELSRKLVDRGYSSDQIRSVVNECLALNYLDDDRFARSYIRELQRKGYGYHRIEQMLMAKGLSREVVDSCLSVCCRQSDQLLGCRQVLLKKLQQMGPVDDVSAVRTKVYRFLLSRGFAPAIIFQTLDENLDNGRSEV